MQHMAPMTASEEHRLKLGMGKDEKDREAETAGVPQVTFHGLRHTHITHLLRSMSCRPAPVTPIRQSP